MKKKKLHSASVVIPVYNSRDILQELVKRLRHVLPELTPHYEVIFVEDGSHDDSWKVIKKLADAFPHIRGIKLMRNYGQHNALLCGIRAAKYAFIITMDDDLQHPPEEIPNLIAQLIESYDVVYGTPQKERHGIWRDIASRVTKRVLHNSMGVKAGIQMSAFRLFRTHIRDAFADYNGAFLSIDVLLSWGTTRFTTVTVRHDPRPTGESNYTFRMLIAHALNMITGFSTLPLRLASITGFLFTLFGLGVLIYVIGRYFILGGSVPGFPFLASIIAIFSGAMLFSMGIIGEYLARMYQRIMERPVYIIRSKTVENVSPEKSKTQ